MDRIADRDPEAVGENDTVMRQLAPAPSVAAHGFFKVKSAAFAPETEIP
jgi:hypothetical protein